MCFHQRNEGRFMITSIIYLLCKIGAGVLPLLYQLKIIRSQAELKELQRRFEAAIRKAEEGALDPVKMKNQHDENMDELKEKHDKVWGTTPSSDEVPPVVSPSAPDPITPDVKKAPRLEAPDMVKEATPFAVTLHNFPENGVTLWADRFKILSVGVARTNIMISLNTSGQRSLIVKVNDKEVVLKRITVEKAR
jgi:hypothetical protein